MRKERKIAIVIVIICILLLPLNAFFAWKFINNTSLTYTPPKGTLSYSGQELARKYFPGVLSGDPLYLLVSSRNASHSIVNDTKFEAFSNYLQEQLSNSNSRIYDIVFDIVGYFLMRDVGDARSRFIGGEYNQTSLMQFGMNHAAKTSTATSAVVSLVDSWCEENGADFIREYTSVALLADDATVGIVDDLKLVDAISLSIALLVLVYCVGSVRLLIIPALTLPSTLFLAFSIMYPVSFAMDVSSFAPEMSLGVVAALSIDYSLFILTRFREQVVQQEAILGRSEETAWIVVKNTAVLSAHNILVSGFTIAVAVGSLAYLPVAFLSTIGITMSVGALCAVFLSLCVQPALLLTFYNFFAHQITWRGAWEKFRHLMHRISILCDPCCCLHRRCQTPVVDDNCEEESGTDEQHSEQSQLPPFKSHEGSTSLTSPFLEQQSGADCVTQADLEILEYRSQSSSPWFRIGLFSTRHPYATFLLVLILAVPFFYFASQTRVDFNVFGQVPRNSPHADVLRRIMSDIGNGSAIPLYLIFSVHGTYDVTFWKTNTMTNVMRSVIEAIVERTGQTYDSITAPNKIPSLVDGRPIWLTAEKSSFLYFASDDYQYLVNRTVSLETLKSAYIIITPPVNPFGSRASEYLNTLQDIINEHARENVFLDYGITGASSPSWGIMRKSMDFFGLQVGLILVGVVLFMLVVFRTVVLPFRMILTVAYTIGVSLGVGVIVFQYKWLRSVWSLLERVENYNFLIPIFSFMLLTALALDYDIFLMTRVIEFKSLGYTDEAAIAKAVWKTGPIISFAGIIMFVTIGSMIFSSVVILAQFAVICATAVIVDTFVVRPFLVPALLCMVPTSWLWWPRRFPELNRGVDDMRLDPKAVEGEEESPQE